MGDENKEVNVANESLANELRIAMKVVIKKIRNQKQS